MRSHSFAYCGFLAATLAATAVLVLGAAPAPAALPGPVTIGGGISLPPLPPPRQFAMRTTDQIQSTDAARAIAVVGPDSVYAGGFVTGRVLPNNQEVHYWRVQKRGPNGVVYWNSSYLVGTEDLQGEINAVATTPDGGVVATGIGRDFQVGSPELTVVKFSASGAFLWKTNVYGRTSAGVNQTGDGEGVSIAVTSAGNVVVAGRIRNQVQDAALNNHDDTDMVVAMLSGSSGAEQWRQLVKGSQFAVPDEAGAVAVDLNDNIVAVGGVRNIGMNKDIAIASFTSAGVARFPQFSVFGTANGDDVATGVAVDGQGRIYVSGYRNNSASGVANKDLWIGKFTTNGTSLFQRDVQGTVPGGEDRALAVGCDTAGNLYACGFTTNTGSPGSPVPAVTSTDFTVGKWDSLTGALVWLQKVDGGVNGDDRARTLAVRANGDLVAGGHLTRNSGPTPTRDFALLRYSAAGVLGFDFRHNGSANQDDQCAGVAFDGTGWAVGAGVVRNAGTLINAAPTGADFAVAM